LGGLASPIPILWTEGKVGLQCVICLKRPVVHQKHLMGILSKTILWFVDGTLQGR
jgi:hypothetical protein